MLVVVASSWFFVTDLLSGGGNWSATVTFLVGLVFLAAAASLDAGSHHPYGFWLHVGAGLTIGGSLVYFLHDGDFEWALIALGGLALRRARRALRPLELGGARRGRDPAQRSALRDR